MKKDRTAYNCQYVIVTLSKPCIYPASEEEAWLLNPPRRYVLNAEQLPAIQDYIETISDLKGASYHHPLMAGKSLESARVLIERYRQRGFGDLLFLTGPLNFMRHVTGNNVKLDVYALADRGQVLVHHPALHLATPLYGPLHYDDLGLYNYQWLIDTVTECNEEPDQLNVYDALYQQLGFRPEDIEPQFKRPSARLVDDDIRHLDQFFHELYRRKNLDFRRRGYYVVAPFSAASLRSLNYANWLEIIEALASRRPVIIVGQASHKIPDMDMAAGSFIDRLAKMNGDVINAVGATRNFRTFMALISRAVACVTLDSGPLYVAQAFRVPAVSIWGSHDPGVRLGYDPDYMELAIWNQSQCRLSPCYAYSQFPAHKCSLGEYQQCCDVLASVSPDQVMKKLDMIESRNVVLKKFAPATA